MNQKETYRGNETAQSAEFVKATVLEEAAYPYTDSQALRVVPKEKRKARYIFRDLLRYSLVGTSSAAIEILLFVFFYQLVGIQVVISNICALALAAIYNFTMNRKWTFKSSKRLLRSLVLYVILVAWNQLFSSWVIVYFMNLGLNALLAKILTMLCIVSWNFVLYRRVVFR